ncbi:MauE/DoxX family redox-associated membrane protein [Dactylosporangium sp. NPDC051484]|uniref:MauE/DoxX family redox-associated membrane protein n=1 Tax=Dactylosporangium sp. NPDC051484 TaxID=3154942 RepID=UPI003450DB7B
MTGGGTALEYGRIFCCTAIGFVFAQSLFDKIRSPERRAAFRKAAGSLAPGIDDRLSALTVVIGEALVVTLLLLGRPPEAMGGAMLLLTIFTAAIVRTIVRRRKVACNCFGPSDTPVGGLHVARNIVLAAITATGLGLCLLDAPAPDRPPATTVTVVAMAATAALVAEPGR